MLLVRTSPTAIWPEILWYRVISRKVSNRPPAIRKSNRAGSNCREDPAVIRKILAHLDEKALSATPRMLPEWRGPAEGWVVWWVLSQHMSCLSCIVSRGRIACSRNIRIRSASGLRPTLEGPWGSAGLDVGSDHSDPTFSI